MSDRSEIVVNGRTIYCSACEYDWRYDTSGACTCPPLPPPPVDAPPRLKIRCVCKGDEQCLCCSDNPKPRRMTDLQREASKRMTELLRSSWRAPAEHAFEQNTRSTWIKGVTEVPPPDDECGVCLDECLNSSTADPVYCRRPRKEHVR